jgi:uncharacterized protein YjbI with pentapeptide repeats
MEILTSFIREKSNDDREPNSKISQVIQAAITVIGRRNTKDDIEGEKLYLDCTNLNEAELRNANLSNIYLLKLNLIMLIYTKLN